MGAKLAPNPQPRPTPARPPHSPTILTKLVLTTPPLTARCGPARVISFFEDLGFTTSFLDDQDNPRYVGLTRNNVEIHVQWNELSSTDKGLDRPVYRFLVRDVDALYREFSDRANGVLAAAQTTPWCAPADTPWGTREFHVRDPSGNGLQFYQSPAPPRSSDA